MHRDIYWLGRQWCVTGYGVQLTDPKWRMTFDVPADRLWSDGLADAVESEPWFDRADFLEAVEVARRRAQDEPHSFTVHSSNEK